MFGGYSTVYGALFDGFVVKKVDSAVKNIQNILPPTDQMASIGDPEIWLHESNVLAQQYAYAEPVRSAKYVAELTREYETNARQVAESQISLAAARLARLLNEALKT
jgi:hypothetical protein